MSRFLSKLLATSLFGTCLFVLADSVQGQQQETVTVNTNLVTMWAEVTTRTDHLPVKGLGIMDFQLQEEGKPQQLSIVQTESPLSIVLLIDGYYRTWPADLWYRRIKESVKQLGEDVEIAVMGFDSTVVLVQPLTKDLNVLADKLKTREAFYYHLGRHLPERIAEARPGEIVLRRIGDATYKATEYLEKATAPNRRKIIIFITERSFWMDETTMHTGAEVEALLEQTDTTVYVLLHNRRGNKVRVHDNDPVYYLFYRQRVKNRLKGGTIEGFIKATGGTSVTGQWEDCDEMFIKLARQIRSTYTIGYYPENTNFDGKFRRIKLELSKSGKAKAGNVNIAVREGYHAVRRSPTKAAETNSKQ